MLRGFRRRDGSAYTTLPDVFVYGHAWDDDRRSLDVATDGPPLFIVEVLSTETHEQDLDLRRGKGYSYRVTGVAEYLTLDPGHRYLPEGWRGWQRDEHGAYVPWRREAEGRWRSRELPLALALEGARAAVYAADGHRILREGEAERAPRAERQAAAANERRLLEEVERLRRRLEARENGA